LIKDFLEIGRIVGTHALKGELRVEPWCDSPDFFKGFTTLYYDEKGTAKAEITSCRSHGSLVLLCLEGISGVEAAAALRGKTLYMRRADAHMPEGSYFVAELIGCEVFDADEPAKRYGTLADVTRTGANDVWHIRGEGGREYLIPAIPDVVASTDVEKGVILIRPLKGIFEDEN